MEFPYWRHAAGFRVVLYELTRILHHFLPRVLHFPSLLFQGNLGRCNSLARAESFASRIDLLLLNTVMVVKATEGAVGSVVGATEKRWFRHWTRWTGPGING